jgi:hypothetical protein
MGFTHQILEAMDVQVISNSDEKMDIFMDKILRTVRTGVTAVSDSRSQQEKPRQQVEDQTYEANFRHKHAARNLTEDDTSGDACDIQSYFKKRLASLQSVAKGNTSVKTGMNSYTKTFISNTFSNKTDSNNSNNHNSSNNNRQIVSHHNISEYIYNNDAVHYVENGDYIDDIYDLDEMYENRNDYIEGNNPGSDVTNNFSLIDKETAVTSIANIDPEKIFDDLCHAELEERCDNADSDINKSGMNSYVKPYISNNFNNKNEYNARNNNNSDKHLISYV